MKKISIVGVEGSGKTVLMSVLGEKYAMPDKHGLSLKAKEGKTFKFCTSIVAAMRKGEWPMPTMPGEISELEWELFRYKGKSTPKVLGNVNVLDFAGEVYRQAFGINSTVDESNKEDVEKLRRHVSQSDILIVLINLKDIIDGDRTHPRTIEMLWLSQSILDFAKKHRVKDVALVFSQADRYKTLLEQHGGVVSAFKKYLPNVMYAFPNVSAFEVSAVDGTRIDDSTGKVVPACDFATTGLDKLMLWIKDRLSPVRRILKTITFISLLAIISVALISSTARCLLHTNVFTWAYERILMLQGIEDKIKKARYELTALETKCNDATEDCQRQKKESDRLQLEVDRQRSIAEQLEHNIDKSRAELVRLENQYKEAVENHKRQKEEFNRWQVKVNSQRSIAEDSLNAAKLNVLQHNTAVNTIKRVQLWEGGPYWADRNIGAENPWDAGYYFWWGDTVGYKRENNKWVASDGSKFDFSFAQKDIPIYGKNISDLQNQGWIVDKNGVNVLTPKHDAASAHWGGDWRMPTKQEWDDLNNKCEWIWRTKNGVAGYVVRGKGSYSSSEIFLPCAGYGYGTSLGNAGSYGHYWSSVPNSDYDFVWILYFYSGYHHSNHASFSYNLRYGQTVRPLQGFTK